MPLYESECACCGKRFEYVKPVAYYQDSPLCCGQKTEKRLFTAPSMWMDIAPWDGYESPVTGKWITSKRERKADLARAGCRPWEGLDQEKKEAARHKRYSEEDTDKKLDKTIEKVWKDIPDYKRAELTA